MTETKSLIDTIAETFLQYCDSMKFHVRQSMETNNIRLDISNASEKTIIKIYPNSTIQIQGKQNSLKTEMEIMKSKFEANSHFVLGSTVSETKSPSKKYKIILPEIKNKIKLSLNTLGTLDISDNLKDPNIEYRAKIRKNDSAFTLTQYINGTLLPQGKTNEFFYECCFHIEKIMNSEDKNVISRLISSDEKSFGLSVPSTKLNGVTEKNVEDKIVEQITVEVLGETSLVVIE